MFLLSPKFKINSLKYAEVSISEIKLSTEGLKVAFPILGVITLISVLEVEISLIVKY